MLMCPTHVLLLSPPVTQEHYSDWKNMSNINTGITLRKTLELTQLTKLLLIINFFF